MLFLRCVVAITLFCTFVDCAWFFGPTANLLTPSGEPDFTLSIAQLLGLLDTTAGRDAWSHVRARVVSSGGALHARSNIIVSMTAAERAQLGALSHSLGLSLSLEAGGAMCGAGSGAGIGEKVAAYLSPVLASGGDVAFVLIESVFSRTVASCPHQAHAETIAQVADFAAAVAVATPRSRFYLYDALPHYSVGPWPANLDYGLDLGAILVPLQARMASRGVPLCGYWMDCPRDYSVAYPNASAPLPAGDGYKKVAAAVALVQGLGLAAAKTFNSQLGGATSGALFTSETLLDFRDTAVALAAAGVALNESMVETWYEFPQLAAPETEGGTTANAMWGVLNASTTS